MCVTTDDDYYKQVIVEHRKRMGMVRKGEVASSEDFDRALEEC
jgi:hypothetical protein